MLYVEDLKRGINKDIGPKDIFELGSSHHLTRTVKTKSRSPAKKEDK